MDHDSFSLDGWDCHINNVCGSHFGRTRFEFRPGTDYPEVFLVLSNTFGQMLRYYLVIGHDCYNSYPYSSFTITIPYLI